MSDFNDDRLLPPNASALERALPKLTDKVANNLGARIVVPESIAQQWNPKDCPANLLPWLAWSLSVDEWDENWPEVTKRALIANAVKIHKHKGTVGAVKRAFAALGLELEFLEWFEQTDDLALAKHHSGKPHTFTFIAWANEYAYTSGAVELGPELYDAIHKVTHQTKPQKAHFNFLVGAKLDLGLKTASISSAMQVKRITYETEPVKAAKSQLSVAVGVIHSRPVSTKRDHCETTSIEGRAQSSLAYGIHLHNRRQQVSRLYFSNDQKLPSGCYYFGSGLSTNLHLHNRRISVGRFYLHPKKSSSS